MATNKELEKKVEELDRKVIHLNTTNSQLLDELVVIKKNYITLVEEVSQRFEAVQKRFRS
jgi:hypothetical protein